MRINEIDEGNEFDWGLASSDYARYRDIYPPEFFDRILQKGLCISGQKVLDLGTGTGVLPRNLYKYGAKFIGADISQDQINEAIRLSKENNMDITYRCIPTENIQYEESAFDVITACQCFFYFNHAEVAEKLYRILMPQGKLVILYMAWLPYEDHIAGASENLVLKYNPKWSGKGETRHHIEIPNIYNQFFDVESEESYDIYVPFTRDSWNGRMRACRGIGASLSPKELNAFDEEHSLFLKMNTPETFEILHYAAMTVLTVKDD